MSRLKGSSFFCEDLRAEQSGQPMFIGILSPQFEICDLPVEFRSLYFVSFFYVKNEDAGAQLRLRINISGSNEDNSHLCGVYHRTISEEMLDDEEESLVIISQPLHGLKVNSGMKISAELNYNEIQEDYFVKFTEGDADVEG